jgi:hypothetical protein
VESLVNFTKSPCELLHSGFFWILWFRDIQLSIYKITLFFVRNSMEYPFVIKLFQNQSILNAYKRRKNTQSFTQGPSIAHTEIVYKSTLFYCCCFANKSKISTLKKWQQKHWFVYKLYGFCCCAYQNRQKKIVIFLCHAWTLVLLYAFLVNKPKNYIFHNIPTAISIYINFLYNKHQLFNNYLYHYNRRKKILIPIIRKEK